jgi:hypothetical protein
LQSEYRKLEAEVGPVKYIAEFIYGEQADTNLLEEAVRWVILIIIFVFDPLAVLLLIAAQYTFEYSRKDKPKDDDGERLRLEREEYEQARAQRIVDNSGYHSDDPTPTEEEEKVDDTAEDEERKIDVAKSYITTDDVVGDVVPENDTADADASVIPVEPTEVQVDETPEQRVRRERYEELESTEDFKNAKQAWKDAHPNETLKLQKKLYIDGTIDHLPWEVPELASKEESKGYIQNEEQQDPNRLWNKLNTGNK